MHTDPAHLYFVTTRAENWAHVFRRDVIRRIHQGGNHMFNLSPVWKETYPDAAVGVLVMSGVNNPASHPELERRKQALEADIRARFDNHSRAELRELPTLAAYHTYYKRYGKNYHVQLQLESVAHKGKSIPRVAALVECMFMAELKNQLLTAGHDMDVVQPPVGIDVATGEETYVLLKGQDQALKAGDMKISDAEGVISSIVHGPDRRTQILPGTRRVLFTVYAPPGIEAAWVQEHLTDIQANVLLVAKEAETELMEVFRI